MNAGRMFGIVWGALLVFVSSAMLLWILYCLIVFDEPSPFPWWWGVVLLGVWSFGVVAGVNRIRGRRVTMLGTARPRPPPEDWSG